MGAFLVVLVVTFIIYSASLFSPRGEEIVAVPKAEEATPPSTVKTQPLAPSTTPRDEEVFMVVEQMPELIGGLGSIQKRIKYPELAKLSGIEGRVFIQFVVDENGNVLDPVVVKGIGGGCDEEAMRALSLAKFKPGKQRGETVKVKMSIPITFRLA